jgi:hypothetical protein
MGSNPMNQETVIIQAPGHEPRQLSANAIERMTRLCAHAWHDEYLWEQREELRYVLEGVLEIYWALHPEHPDMETAEKALGKEHFLTY